MATAANIKEMSRESLVENFSAFVGKIVTTMLRSLSIRVEREDLHSYGILGLLEAQDRFDPDGKTKFETFAYYRVRGAILDGCRKEGWLSRERSKKSAKQIRSVDAYMEDVSDEREATGQAKSLSDSIDRVTEVVSTAATIILMQDQDLHELVGQSDAEQHTNLEKRQTKVLLKRAIATLNDEEKDIVIRFDFNQERMEDIGNDYGYSKAWVSRVRNRALNRMRAYIENRES